MDRKDFFYQSNGLPMLFWFDVSSGLDELKELITVRPDNEVRGGKEAENVSEATYVVVPPANAHHVSHWRSERTKSRHNYIVLDPRWVHGSISAGSPIFANDFGGFRLDSESSKRAKIEHSRRGVEVIDVDSASDNDRGSKPLQRRQSDTPSISRKHLPSPRRITPTRKRHERAEKALSSSAKKPFVPYTEEESLLLWRYSESHGGDIDFTDRDFIKWTGSNLNGRSIPGIKYHVETSQVYHDRAKLFRRAQRKVKREQLDEESRAI